MTCGKPFFVVGFQRSGTTLLRLMLDSHPDLAISLDTVGLWERYHNRLPEFNNLGTDQDVDALAASLIAEERIQLWGIPLTVDGVRAAQLRDGFPGVIDAFNRCYALHHGKTRWGDKDPGNMRRIDLIDGWFPDAQFVHLIRDGRDACLSLLRQDFGPESLLECAELWREEVWWVRKLGALLGPRRYCEVRYESLVEEPELELRKLTEFLEADYAPEMLSYHQRLSLAVPQSKRHLWPLLEKPPQKQRIGTWKREMSRSARIAFEKRARSVLTELDYEVLPTPLRGGWWHELLEFVNRILRGTRRRLSPKRSIPTGVPKR